MALSPKILTTSVPCQEGDDGSNVVSLKSTCTCPVYQDPVMSSGISTRKLTDGVMEVFVKSWSPTSKLVDERTSTCQSRSAAATGKPGSPTFTLCLSSKQAKTENVRKRIAYSRMYLKMQAA